MPSDNWERIDQPLRQASQEGVPVSKLRGQSKKAGPFEAGRPSDYGAIRRQSSQRLRIGSARDATVERQELAMAYGSV